MAYDKTKLNMVSRAPIAGAGQHWRHESVDASTVVRVTGFITDGGQRGMKVGDTLEHWETDTNIVTNYIVISVSATSPGAVDLGDATVIASGTNTD